MKQAIVHTQTLIASGNATTYFPVLGSPGLLGGDSTSRTPVPWALTVRNLVFISRDPARVQSVTVTLMKNGSPTLLSVTLPAGFDGPVSMTTVDVDYSRFDDINLRFQADDTGGFIGAFSLEIESAGNVYGICNRFSSGVDAGEGAQGGALGNGTQSTYVSATESNSYSICSVAGTVTTIVAKCYSGAPAVGSSWIGLIRLNGVEQDGSGGTIDTRCEIVAGQTTAVATISLPLTPGQHVELVYYRTGASLAGASSGHVALSIGFQPDEPGWYMLTGGSNNTLTQPGYVWMRSEQNETDENLALAPIGLSGIVARGLYLECSPPGPTDADQVTFVLRRSQTDTDITVLVSGLAESGSSLAALERFGNGDTIDIAMVITAGTPSVERLYWGVALSPIADDAVIGPLAWVHWPRRLPGSPTELVTDTYSDMDMQCPSTWENGFKEGLITEWGEVRRPSSHLFTGDWQGTTFSFQIADKQGRFRAQQGSLVDRYWNEPLTVRMTTRANRALEGTAFTVFCGPIIDAQPTSPLLWDITLGDVVSQGLLSDQAQVPWRKIRDGFLSQLTEISDRLDRDSPEPILYGVFDRIAGEPSSPAGMTGLRVKPIYLGIMDVAGEDVHTWMVAGHACASVRVYVDGDEQNGNLPFPFPGAWLIPGQSAWTSNIGTDAFLDKTSDTFGNNRRYTLVFGQVGSTHPDRAASGDEEILCAVEGVEDIGDGTGALITDRFQQYKHFLINYVANQAQQSYQSGEWLDNPTWDLFDGPVLKVDEDSFDNATAIGLERIAGGYIGAAAIGQRGGDRLSVKSWIADWNRSCACRFGITHNGQMRIFLVRPTQDAKDAAPLYTDAYEILDGSFATEMKWDEHATTIPYKADYYEPTGEYLTSGAVSDPEAITNYGRDIPSEDRIYPFAPGLAQVEHLATLELRIRKHRPRYIRLDATIGPNPVTDDSLGYLDIGDYIRYQCFDAIQSDEQSPSAVRQERLAQIIDPGIPVGPRRVSVIAMDVEDLIDYDVDASPGA